MSTKEKLEQRILETTQLIQSFPQEETTILEALDAAFDELDAAQCRYEEFDERQHQALTTLEELEDELKEFEEQETRM